MEPIITTLIPTFRRPQLLRRSLARVLRQQYPNFQVLVLDNASGDETGEVVAEIMAKDPRVKYHCHPKNIGLRENFEYGISRVETPYFSMHGDDDFLEVDFYEKCMKTFQDYPDAAFVGGRCLVMTHLGQPWLIMPDYNIKPGYVKPPFGILSMLSGRLINHFVMTAFLFRVDRVREIGVWRNEPNYITDVDLMLRLAVLYPYALFEGIALTALVHGQHRPEDFLPRLKGWIEFYRDFLDNTEVPETIRGKASAKFLGQLRRAFTKIWFRRVAEENWAQAYSLSDMLGEDLAQTRLSDVLFRANQYFRKNPGSPRLDKLRRALQKIDRKYQRVVLEKSGGYWEALQDELK